jgi:NAD(P)-dependent dehydrogenase (short-subunit alcohol dehydrogenase family)
MTIRKGVELLALLEALGVLVELQPASASAAAVTIAGMAINLFETTLFPLTSKEAATSLPKASCHRTTLSNPSVPLFGTGPVRQLIVLNHIAQGYHPFTGERTNAMVHPDFLSFPSDAVAVVTGAGAGIGREIARTLLAAGVSVSAWDMAENGLLQLEAENLGRMGSYVLDIASPDAVADALASSSTDLGPAAFLVNNAGPPSGTPFSFNAGIAASLGSLESVTSLWLETEGSMSGTVVNIASVSGSFIGVGAQPWYPAAKAGIAGFTRYLALNRPNGIRANAIAPGMTETVRTRDNVASAEGQAIVSRNPLGRPAKPSDIAAGVVYLLAPVSAYINGVILPIDGGSLLTQ